MPKYVIDQNMLNDAPTGIARLLAAAPDLTVVVPDTAFVEMMKSEEWELTMELSLRELHAYPGRVEMVIAVGEALGGELRTGRPTFARDLLPDALQELVGELIEAFSGDADQLKREVLRSRIVPARTELLETELDQQAVKTRTGRLLETWIKGLDRRILRLVGSPSCDPKFATALAQVNADSFTRLVAERDLRMSEVEAMAFVAAKPLVLRYFMAHALYSIRAAQRGPSALQQTGAGKELNNQLDLEYGIVATYIDGLLTNDRRAREAYESLREMIERPLEEAAHIVRKVLQSNGVAPRTEECTVARDAA
jgi:hypothetical protein